MLFSFVKCHKLIRRECNGIEYGIETRRQSHRREAVVAERRKLELLNDTLTAKVVRAAQAPIQHCLVPETLFDDGMGTVVLARGNTPHYLAIGMFLIDTWCLGVKDTFFRSVDAQGFETMIAGMDRMTPMASVDPSYARKLLRDAAAWAASIGFAPHRDFAAIERLFGDVSADASPATFQFGREGKSPNVQRLAQPPTQFHLPTPAGVVGTWFSRGWNSQTRAQATEL